MQLNGRRVLVTGGTRGIGEAIARACAAKGARLALVARDAVALERVATELGATAHPADLSRPEEVDGLLDRVEADGGPVDVLVNNAGIDVTGHFADITAAELARIYQVNLVAPAELCRQAVGRMTDRGAGHIVNISSLAGTAPFPGLAAYSSTKAGLSQLTAGLRADQRNTPVRTTLVELGPIPTDMLDHVENHRPTAASFARFGRLQLLPEVPRETVADAVVDAIEHDRRHVRLPKRAAGFAMMTEAPRRLVELLLTGLPHQA